jgi:hypothetical protein
MSEIFVRPNFPVAFGGSCKDVVAIQRSGENFLILMPEQWVLDNKMNPEDSDLYNALKAWCQIKKEQKDNMVRQINAARLREIGITEELHETGD